MPRFSTILAALFLAFCVWSADHPELAVDVANFMWRFVL